MKDDKYITFKREEWNKLRDHARLHDMGAFRTMSTMEGGQLDDAFVIRSQDRFAEAALNAYISALLTTSEIMKELPFGKLERERIMALCDRLERIADVAAQRSMEAHGAKRLPT